MKKIPNPLLFTKKNSLKGFSTVFVLFREPATRAPYVFKHEEPATRAPYVFKHEEPRNSLNFQDPSDHWRK